jgi:hypothetical protein
MLALDKRRLAKISGLDPYRFHTDFCSVFSTSVSVYLMLPEAFKHSCFSDAPSRRFSLIHHNLRPSASICGYNPGKTPSAAQKSAHLVHIWSHPSNLEAHLR